jgi:hypothetical protein
MSKKVNEMTSSASVAGGMTKSPFKKAFTRLKETDFVPAKAAVYPADVNPSFNPDEPETRKNRKLKGKKLMKRKPKYTLAVLEKQEGTLREAIRQLVFLNKVKFYEEQTKQAIQENKLRGVIRQLLMEKDDVIFSTTGQNEANDVLARMKTIFTRYSKITSQQKDREDYKKGFITAMTVSLNNLKKSLSLFGGNAAQTAQAPAKRKDLDEQGEEVEAAGEEMATPEQAPIAKPPQMDDKTIEKQAQDSALKMFPKAATSDSADIKKGINDVTKIIADFVNTYRNLSDEKFQVTEKDGTVRTTSDREDFEKFLLGDPNTSTPGNIQLEFDKIDDTVKSSDKSTTPEPVKIVTSAKKEAETVAVDQSEIPATPGVEQPEAATATTPEDLAAQV